MKSALRLLLWSAAFLLAGQMHAQTITWSATANNNSFSNGSNWVGGVAPSGGNNVVFQVSTNQNLLLTAPVTLGDITFSGIQDGYYLNSDGGQITLNGNIVTTVTPASYYWGLIDVPITLSATSHTMAAGGASEVGADIYLTNTIDGTGSILKTGDRMLALYGSNTFSGGLTLVDGTLSVSNNNSLGTGTVILLGGTLETSKWNFAGSVDIGNNLELGPVVAFRSAGDYNTPALYLTGQITAATGITDVHIRGNGGFLDISGVMANGSAGATTYRFENGSFYLSGANTYTGGTEVRNGAYVIIEWGQAIPSTGLISSQADGYLGLADSEYFPSVDVFLTHIDKPNFKGTLGFDYANTFTGNLDLTNFDPGVTIGTTTTAFLQAAITPVGGAYRFRVGGRLNLTSATPLAGSNDLEVSAFVGRNPGAVVVSNTAASTYTGSTTVDTAGLIFDSAGSLPSTSTITILNGGYVGVTETSGTTFAGLLTQLGSYGTAIVGVDESSQVNGTSYGPYIYSGAIDLSSLATPIYLGSATYTKYTGLITTTDDDLDDYYLSGFASGNVQIDSLLSGTRSVHVGIPGAQQDIEHDDFASVTLSNAANSYTGGTFVNSGRLVVANPTAAGTGDITLAPSGTDSTVTLQLPTSAVFSNNLNFANGKVNLYAPAATLTGTLSGSADVTIRSNLTLAAANTFSGFLTVDFNELRVAHNSALGTAAVELIYGGDLSLETTAPVIHDLAGGLPYDYDGYDYSYVTFNGPSIVNLTIQQDYDADFHGTFINGSSTGTLTKTGAGTLTLYGEHDYYDTPFNGDITILNGTLVAGSSDALGSGSITINGGRLGTLPGISLSNSVMFGPSGGRLEGNGYFNSHITAGYNVVLAPGASPGTLTFTSGLTLDASGELEFQVQFANGAAGTGYDLVSVSNGLLDITATSGSPFKITLTSLDSLGVAGNVSDFSSSTGYTWMLFQGNAAGGITGYSPANFTIDATGFTNSLNGGVFYLTLGTYGSDPAIFLNFAPVPEPSTYALLGLGLVSGLWVRRRRR